jgi:ATP-dependent DNA helicase RecQ
VGDALFSRDAPSSLAPRSGLPVSAGLTVDPRALDRDIETTLKDVFGFDRLRTGQREVMGDVMAGRPVVAVMPTGAGKSLCYQLPGVLLARTGGLTLVVSPLIALMKDQVDALAARGVACAALTSAASPEEQTEILGGIRRGSYHLVYVAPERFASRRFLSALAESRGRLALFAVDEAHCISEWGHEFRPAYRALGEVVRLLAPPRLLALTATATQEVRRDIARALGVDAAFHVRGFSRPNLRLLVEPVGGVSDKKDALIARIRGRARGSALVYAATRKNAEAYAGLLQAAGLRSAAYHAGLGDADRSGVQDRFMDDKLDAVVATNAFGMGIDKSDVRLVVHAELPRSPEAYYQEAGRAGRDGAPAECSLLFNYSDVRVQEFLIDASYPSAEVLRALWKLLRDQPQRLAPDRLREELPGRPHGSVVESAARILARHGLVTGDDRRLQATRPEELGGEFPPFDPAALARRAEVERGKLRSMVDYGYHDGCRHQFLVSYFGDPTAAGRPTCQACDRCLGLAPRVAGPSERGTGRGRGKGGSRKPRKRPFAAGG